MNSEHYVPLFYSFDTMTVATSCSQAIARQAQFDQESQSEMVKKSDQ